MVSIAGGLQHRHSGLLSLARDLISDDFIFRIANNNAVRSELALDDSKHPAQGRYSCREDRALY